MRKAFTLIELIVVAAIIGVLSSVLIVSFSSNRDSANAAKCMTNMRHLAEACYSFATENGRWPVAGSYDKYSSNMLTDSSRRIEAFQGWIGWSSTQPGGSYVSPYSNDPQARIFCMTNGVLWKYAGEDSMLYVCPTHLKTVKEKAGKAVPLGPCWSYAMNAYFCWNDSGRAHAAGYYGIRFESLSRSDRVLLFAELPFLQIKNYANQKTQNFSSGVRTDADPILQYQDCTGGGNEIIGFNHKTNNRETHAHVCFADAHVEKLILPKNPDVSNLRKLTKWLCSPYENGKSIDVNYNGKSYEAISN